MNRMSNLRAATSSQNAANMRRKSKSATGYRGVYPLNGRFVAKMMKDYKSVSLGSYGTPEAAYAAYCAGMKREFGKFASVE